MVGEGSASAKAEFLKLNLSVTADCHASSREARRRADAAVQQVLNALKGHVEAQVERQLEVFPGSNTQAERTRYIRGDGEQLLCDLAHGWRSQSTINFKLTHIDALPELQDTILELNPVQSEVVLNKPQLTIIMGSPVPAVFQKSYDALQDAALKKAYADALRQVNVLLELTPGMTAKLVKVTSTRDISGAVSYDRTAMAPDPTGATLGSVTVSVSRSFVFKTEAPN